jgi:hypothetical protein
MAENLVGTIAKSSDHGNVGQHITFVGLHSTTPKVVFENTGGTSPVQRVFEDDTTLTLVLVGSATGGVDAFVINKKTGLFANVSASGSLSTSENFGVSAVASVGSCK